ncbi:PilW family protein, partial [Pseudomonas aeruginosa]|uniref:PilW family protein n=1 Tax=Pseudomonas aeruginosa TaxID=287 RepID=UPI001D02167E
DRPPPFHPWKLFFKAYPTKSLSLPLYPTIFSLYPSGLSHSLSPATADVPGSLACSAQTIKEKGQEIVSGLVDFKLEYGVGPTMAGKREVESFVEQANIADRPVRALRYSALMASDKNLRQGDSKTLDDWITLYPSSKTSLQGNDKDRLYQIAKGSQTLRNLVP